MKVTDVIPANPPKKRFFQGAVEAPCSTPANYLADQLVQFEYDDDRPNNPMTFRKPTHLLVEIVA